MCNFIIYTASQMLGVTNSSSKMGEECGMHGSEGNLEQIIDLKAQRKEAILKAYVNMGR
jgi:hypothetical protein